MPASWRFLTALRLTRIVQTLQDTRTTPQNLRFLNRTNLVPATDGEIVASVSGLIQIADLVADDQSALVYNSGKIALSTNTIPNIKHGTPVTQEMLNFLQAIEANVARGGEQNIFSNYVNRTLDNLLLGVRQRMEALLIAMHLGGFSYNRLGIRMDAVTWGIPAALKITAAIPWDNVNATPVSDVWTARRYASIVHGKDYTRLQMSSQAFMFAIATTEFQNKAKAFLAPGVNFNNLSTENLDAMQSLAERTFGCTIERYDTRFQYQQPDGTRLSEPFLPITQVILDSPENDNNDAVKDFANGVVTESIVADLVDGVGGGLGGPQYGPVSYPTAPPDLNPPNVILWAVARGFPRRHDKAMNAVLTVGTFTDSIPATAIAY